MSERIERFTREHRFLSNFFRCLVRALGRNARVASNTMPMSTKPTARVEQSAPAAESESLQDGGTCCICDNPITPYDSYGISDKYRHRYHWECVKREAATVSAPSPAQDKPPQRKREHLVPSAGYWFEGSRKAQAEGKHAEAVAFMENAYNHVENALAAAQEKRQHQGEI